MANTYTTNDILAILYNAVGRAGEVGTASAFKLQVAVNHDPRTGLPTPVGNSGYTLGLLQYDFGQRSAGVPHNTDEIQSLIDSYNSWASSNGLSDLTDTESLTLLSDLTATGQQIAQNPSTLYLPVNSPLLVKINQFLKSGNGIQFANGLDQDVLNTSPGFPGLLPFAQQIAMSATIQNMSFDDGELAIASLSKVFNQNEVLARNILAGLAGQSMDFDEFDSYVVGQIALSNLTPGAKDSLYTGTSATINGMQLVEDIQGSSTLSSLWTTQVARDPSLVSSFSTTASAQLFDAMLRNPTAGEQLLSAISTGIGLVIPTTAADSGETYIAGVTRNGTLFTLTSQGAGQSYSNGTWSTFTSGGGFLIQHTNGQWVLAINDGSSLVLADDSSPTLNIGGQEVTLSGDAVTLDGNGDAFSYVILGNSVSATFLTGSSEGTIETLQVTSNPQNLDVGSLIPIAFGSSIESSQQTLSFNTTTDDGHGNVVQTYYAPVFGDGGVIVGQSVDQFTKLNGVTLSEAETISYSAGQVVTNQYDGNRNLLESTVANVDAASGTITNSSTTLFGEGTDAGAQPQITTDEFGDTVVSIDGQSVDVSNGSLIFSSIAGGTSTYPFSLDDTASLTFAGGGNAISADGLVAGSVFTLEGTSANSDTLNFVGATDVTALLGNAAATVDLGTGTSLVVSNLDRGDAVIGVSADALGDVAIGDVSNEGGLSERIALSSAGGGSGTLSVGGQQIVNFDPGSSISINAGTITIGSEQAGESQKLAVDGSDISIAVQSADGSSSAQWSGQISGQLTLSNWSQNGITYVGGDVVASVLTEAATSVEALNVSASNSTSSAYSSDVSSIANEEAASLPSDLTALIGMDVSLAADVAGLNYLSERIDDNNVSNTWIWDFIGPPPGSTFNLSGVALPGSYDPAALHLLSGISTAVGAPNNTSNDGVEIHPVPTPIIPSQQLDPLVLDLDGGGINLIPESQSSATFDVADTGTRQDVGWVGVTNGILVFDQNHSGTIDNASELFGADFSVDGTKAPANQTGFQALMTLAQAGATNFSEATSLINPTTGVSYFDELQVWVDANQNGQTDAGELYSLEDLGISSISFQSSQLDENIGGNEVASTATYTTSDGTTRAIDDVGLATTAGGTTDIFGISSAGALAVGAYVSKGYAATAAGQAQAITSGIGSISVNFSSEITAIQAWANTVRILEGSTTTIEKTPNPQDIAIVGTTPIANAVPGFGEYIVYSTAPQDTVNALNNITALAPVAANSANAIAAGANAVMSSEVAGEKADLSGTSGDVNAALVAAQSANAEWGQAIAGYLNASAQVNALSAELANVGAEIAQLIPINYNATNNLSNGYSYFSGGDAALAADTFAGLAAGQQSFAALKDALDRSLSAIAQEGDFQQAYAGQAGVATTLDGGRDVFLASGGSETLIDGAGQDIVLLNPDSGNLTIEGFKVGANGDQLQFLDVGSSLSLSDDGTGGTLIHYGNSQTVDLVGVSAASIDLFNNIVGVSAVSYAGVSARGVRGTGSARVYDGQIHVTSITASDAGDTLSGDTAATTLVGGNGNDTFDIDGNGYSINGDAGMNTVSYFNVPLGVTVSLQSGTDSLGSTLFDIQNVKGSIDDDNIEGDTSNNVLDGGGGSDTLIGAGGNDTYVFSSGYGQDVIENGVAANGIPSGELLLGAGISANDLWLTQSGNDLVIQILGTDSQVTVEGWYSNSWQQLESIALSNGLQISPQTVARLVELQSLYVASNPGFDPQTAQAMPSGIDLTNYFVPPSNPTTVPVATNVALATEHQYDGGYATQGANSASSCVSAVNGQVSAVSGANNNANAWAVGGKPLPAPYGAGDNYAYQYTLSSSSLTFIGLYARAFNSGLGSTPAGLTGYTQISSLVSTTFYIQETVTISPPSSSEPTTTTQVYVGDPNVMGNVISAVATANGLIATAAALAQDVVNTDTAEQTALGAAVSANSEGASFNSQAAILARTDALNAEASFAAAIAAWVPTENNLQSAGGILQSSQAALNGVLPGRQVVTQQEGTVLRTYTTTYSLYTSTDQNQFGALQSAQNTAEGALSVANSEFGTLLAALQDFGPYADAQVAGPSANLAADSGGDLLVAAGAGYHVLTGGAGRDTFAFGSWNDASTAAVQNFQTGTEGDRLLIVPAVNRTAYITDSGSTTDVSFYVSSGAVDTVALTGVGLDALSLYDDFEGVDTADFINETHAVTVNLESVTPRSYDGSTHIQNLIGSNYGDTLIGDEQDNVITGGAGNDTLSGGAGNNVLNGGGGVNTVSYAGNPTGVTINLSAGTATNGYGGTDTLTNIQNVIGSAGNDVIVGDGNANVLSGGAGNDTLAGNGGADTYLFQLGDGQDVIVNGVTGNAGPSGQLTLGTGLSTTNLWFSQSGEDLVIQVVGTQDSMTIQDWFLSTTSYRQLSDITLADGTTLSATNVANVVSALAAAAPGFEPSTATALPSAAAEATAQFWAVDIEGTAGNDNLVADGPNDRLVGNGGEDSYLFNLGNSQETIVNGVSTNTGPSGTLVLGEGITPNNLWFTQAGNDLVIQVMGTTDRITVQDWFSNSFSQLRGLVLADGSTISGGAMSTLAAAMDSYQTSNPSFNSQTTTQLPVDMTLSSTLDTAWSRDITGTVGSETLLGEQGADQLDGGLGNDTLTGGAGVATYVFNANYGQDVIVNGVASNSGPSGTLTLGGGLSQQNLWFVQSGDDLVIQELGTTSQITVKGWFSNGYSQLQSIVADGVTLGTAGVTQLAQAMTSYQASNTGFSASTAPSMPAALESAIDAAWPGGKTLTGTAGNDALDPTGQSRDTLVGGGGIDTYNFSTADGEEIIINGVSTDQVARGQVVLGAGLDPNNLWFSRTGADLVIQELGTSVAVTVKGWYSNTYSQFGYLTLADGSMISSSQINGLVAGMAAYVAANPSFNPSVATQMPGDASAAANALYSVLTTGWTRQVYAQAGDGGDVDWGVDQVRVSSGNQTIIGSRSNDATYFFGNDLGQVTIVGQPPANGAQEGGLLLPPGISPGSLWFTQVGNDLHIQFLGSSSGITYTNWFSGAALAYIGGSADPLIQMTTAEVNALTAAMTGYQSANPQFNPQTTTVMPASMLLPMAQAMPGLELDDRGGTYESGSFPFGLFFDPASSSTIEISNVFGPLFFLNRGYGQDKIETDDEAQTGTVFFGAGIDAGNLWITQTGYDLKIQLLGTQTQLVVQDWFTPGTTYYQLQGLGFSDSYPISTAQISALAAAMTAYQTAHPSFNPQLATELPDDPSITAAVDADWARTVDLRSSSSVFSDEGFGPGNVTVVGGDRFEFAVGDGNQILEPSVSATGLPVGALEIDGGLSVKNVWFSQSGQNLVIQFLGKSDSVTIDNWFKGSAYQLQTITLNGQQITASAVNVLEQTMSSYQSANPSFSPSSVTALPNNASVLAAVDSNWSAAPIVNGTSSSDVLDGSGKFETLVGSGGTDTYLFGQGDGVEQIVNGVSSNNVAAGELLLGTGTADTSVWFDRVDNVGNVSSSGNNLRLDILGTRDSITVDNWFTAGANFSQLGEIELSDSGLKLDAQMNTLVQAMASFESSFTTVNGGATFDPSNLSNATITDPTLLAAVNAAWHH